MEVYGKMLITALLVGILCGTVNVLVDLDHPVGYLLGLPNRFLHTPYLIASSGIIFCTIAYLGGLLS